MSQNTSQALTNFEPIPFAARTAGAWNAVYGRLREKIWERRRTLILTVELILVAISLFVNLRLFAMNGNPQGVTSLFLAMLPMALMLRYASFRILGICDQSFRHAGIADAIAIAESVALGSAFICMFYALLKSSFGISVPKSFFVGDGITLLVLLFAYHFGARVYLFSSEHSVQANADTRRAVIVGAGDAGASVLKELLAAPRAGVIPVALVDDDPIKKGTRICGVPVAAGLDGLTNVLFTFQASEVLICIPSATNLQRRRILAVCRECGVPVRTLPCVSDLLNHRASSRDLRTISMEDVLLRERFVPDPSLTKSLVEGKVVLVTGAGGSIGSELCSQLAAAGPARIVLVDKSENSLFYCNLAIEEAFPGLSATPVLLDVTDQFRVREMMFNERPDIVFHAAAFKHVGMMERYPEQAIRNNVLGTKNVLSAAVECGVETFVNVSTDKAVNPRCFMGLSKKLTEMIVKQTAERNGVRYMNVRFGNVAGSAGSVLQIFSERINKGKQLSVTDPHATRYFMSIAEAVNLILCAATMGRGGETFIFNMGNPVNIYELARTLTLFAGVVPGEELPIHFTGLRDGEKVAEELWEDWEDPQATSNPQIFQLQGSNPFPVDIFAALDRFQELLAAHDQAGLLDYINGLVPTFPQERAGISGVPGMQVQEDYARIGA